MVASGVLWLKVILYNKQRTHIVYWMWNLKWVQCFNVLSLNKTSSIKLKLKNLCITKHLCHFNQVNIYILQEGTTVNFRIHERKPINNPAKWYLEMFHRRCVSTSVREATAAILECLKKNLQEVLSEKLFQFWPFTLPQMLTKRVLICIFSKICTG